MLICTCDGNTSQPINTEILAKEALFRFGESIDKSSLRNCIIEYNPEYAQRLEPNEEGYLIDLSVCIQINDYDLTHSWDCVFRNRLYPAINSLTEKLYCELIKCHQSVNNGKERYIKSKKILLTFYQIKLPLIAPSMFVRAENNVSLAVCKDYDINYSGAVFKISTYIKARFVA